MSKLSLGIICPQDLVERIVKQLNPLKMKNIEYTLFLTQQVEETKTLNHEQLNKCDLLFFVGQTTYEIYYKNKKTHIEYNNTVPITISYDGSALHRLLYELAIETKGTISSFTPFTIDVFSEAEVFSSLDDVGLQMDDFILVDTPPTYSTDEWANKHEYYFRNGQSKYAITGIGSVANELKRRGIPVKRLVPTHASVQSALELLYAKSEILLNNDMQTAAILIKWHEPDRRPKNRYNFYRQKIQFEELIIDFCEQYQASLSFPNENQALIYTNKLMTKEFTNNFRNIPFITKLEEKTGNKISVGIGISSETVKAEHFAENALKFADQKNKSCAYITFENGDIRGPLQNEDVPPLTFTTSFDNEQLQNISTKTNLSAVTISRFISLIHQNKSTRLTVHQLAEAFDISLRTASRLLKQLEQADMAKIIGEEQPPGRGRPRKIYDLLLPSSFDTHRK